MARARAAKRAKQIGIRKVSGASVSQIIMMLARKPLWLVLAGSVIASVTVGVTGNEHLRCGIGRKLSAQILLHPF